MDNFRFLFFLLEINILINFTVEVTQIHHDILPYNILFTTQTMYTILVYMDLYRCPQTTN